MTEEEWLACTEPDELMDFVSHRCDQNRFQWMALTWGDRIDLFFDDEGTRIFEHFKSQVLGTNTNNFDYLPRQLRPLVYPAPAVRYADWFIGAIVRGDWIKAAYFAARSWGYGSRHLAAPEPRPNYSHTHKKKSKKAVAQLLKARQERLQRLDQESELHLTQTMKQFAEEFRDIFGNPFRPVEFLPSWRTEHTIGLASQMYESRNFSAMPFLADALEDAGCDNTDILKHCREEGTHVRGCWVVDLVLGKA